MRLTASLRGVFAVARATALESLQRPVSVLLALACFELVALQPLVQLHSFGEPGRLSRDGGMAFMLVFGLVFAVFCAGEGFARELRDGTAAAALAGPVSRPAFVLGKYLGVATAVAVFSWCQSWAVALAVRTSEAFFETARFAGSIRDVGCGAASVLLPAAALAAGAAADVRRRRFGLWFFGSLAALCPVAAAALGFFDRNGSWLGAASWNPGLDARLAVPLALVAALLLALAAWTTAFATRLQTGPVLALSALLLALGFFAEAARTAALPVRAAFALVPDVQSFWLADALRAGGMVPPGVAAGAALYAAFHVAAALCVAAALFENRDL